MNYLYISIYLYSIMAIFIIQNVAKDNTIVNKPKHILLEALGVIFWPVLCPIIIAMEFFKDKSCKK